MTAATAITLAYARNAHVAWFALGAVGASQLGTLMPNKLTVAKGIKKVVRQPRPPPAADTSSYSRRPKKTYGMPSTHSTALTFFYAYLAPLNGLTSIPLTIAWILGLWSRRELGYHTGEQIAVGAAIGAFAALVWRMLWIHYFNYIQTSWSLIMRYIQL